MKSKIPVLLFMFISFFTYSQFDYEPSILHPYGLPNPNAPHQLLDFAPLIGECDCESLSRKADQSWAEPVKMIWRFKYIMNGMGVQDETLKADGRHSGSIRQFIPDSTSWYVHYYSSEAPSTILPTWEGVKNEEGDIVLYNEQKAPNGMEGFYKITFSNMDENGFTWLGEWVSKDESFSYQTWKIECVKRKTKGQHKEKQKILDAIQNFSKAYINGDYNAIANSYTMDGKIFPNNTSIIEGREAIKKQWILPENTKILNHKIEPKEIKFIGDYAYDYGYYHGSTKNPNGSIANWKGKYVIVWKKEEGNWKIYLDIWNKVAD
jgi:ketosteroid isomerase-like protein